MSTTAAAAVTLPMLLERLRNLLGSAEINEDQVTNALGKLSKFCLDEKYLEDICQEPKLVEKMISIADTFAPRDVANRALICLGNLALFPTSAVASAGEERDALIEMSMHIVERMLIRREGEEISEEEMDCGLSGAFILCRTVGNHESGAGVEMLENTPVIREKLYWILEQVLDAGEDGLVLGFAWDPANILQDLATLSNSDRLKPLICNFIPLVLRALRERGQGNFRLVKFATHALAQFVFEPKSLVYFWHLREEIKQQLLLLMNNSKFKQEEREYAYVYNEMQGLIGTLDEMSAPDTAVQAPASVQQQQQGHHKHVLISYQWDNIKLATEIQVRLAAAGFRTWMDIMNQGEANYNDSMSFAIEHACAIICILSAGYVSSASCRKEFEYAHVRGNIQFILVNGTEHPLDLQVGDAPDWLLAVVRQGGMQDVIESHGVDFERVWGEIENALHGMSEEEEESEEDGTDSREHDMFKLLIDMMGELKRENMQLKAQMRALEQINQLILADMDQLKNKVEALNNTPCNN